jgi:hypothetical protein
MRRPLAVLAASATIACTVPLAAAGADVTPMAPQQRERTTVDGWVLSVSLADESINTVPNLAGAQNSREAFVTLSARADIGGQGANPITAGSFEAGYQVGCQVDVSQGLQIGGTGGLAGSVGAAPGLQAEGSGSLGGYMQTNLQPGVITTLKMGSMPLVAHVGYLDMQDVHLKVDACGGAVTVRSYATMAIGTDIQQTQVSVFGDPMVLQ